MVPPTLDRLPEPGSTPAPDTTIAGIKDPDEAKTASKEELQRRQDEYCKVNYEQAKQRGDETTADNAVGPLGPCRAVGAQRHEELELRGVARPRDARLARSAMLQRTQRGKQFRISLPDFPDRKNSIAGSAGSRLYPLRGNEGTLSLPPIQGGNTMKIWNKPQVREQEVGLEVTSYLPAEIDII